MPKGYYKDGTKMIPPKGFGFKKCQKPWNTGKRCPTLSLSKIGDKNPMWKGGYNKKECDKKYSQTENGKKRRIISREKFNNKPGQKEKNNINKNKWKKYKIKNDPHYYKIKRNVSNGIWCKIVRGRGFKKDLKISSLPYTTKELMEHLEKLFKPGMSWENYGKWHIDHIIPDCNFKYKSMNDADFLKSWSLNNLQPLWAIENLKKGKKCLS